MLFAFVAVSFCGLGNRYGHIEVVLKMWTMVKLNRTVQNISICTYRKCANTSRKRPCWRIQRGKGSKFWSKHSSASALARALLARVTVYSSRWRRLMVSAVVQSWDPEIPCSSLVFCHWVMHPHPPSSFLTRTILFAIQATQVPKHKRE